QRRTLRSIRARGAVTRGRGDRRGRSGSGQIYDGKHGAIVILQFDQMLQTKARFVDDVWDAIAAFWDPQIIAKSLWALFVSPKHLRDVITRPGCVLVEVARVVPTTGNVTLCTGVIRSTIKATLCILPWAHVA